MGTLLILDSLFGSLDVERAIASARGWSIELWSGDERELGMADAVAHVRTRIGRELVEKMPRCRVIGRFGTGLDSVDLEAAHAAGMAVVNVRDYCVTELASHTIGLALCLERRLKELAAVPAADALDVNWPSFAARTPIRGRTTATIVGLGSIGSAVAASLKALGYDVLAVTEHCRPAAERIGVDVVGLEEGVASSSIVFLHKRVEPGLPTVVDAGLLAKMRNDAVLVNTARIALIDEAAVADAIATGRLAGLGLDAYLEPTSPLRPLVGDPRVFITPHIGWYSERSARQLREQTITAAIDAYQGADERTIGAKG